MNYLYCYQEPEFPTILNLVQSMIEMKAMYRVKAREVLLHPYFWDRFKKRRFIEVINAQIKILHDFSVRLYNLNFYKSLFLVMFVCTEWIPKLLARLAWIDSHLFLFFLEWSSEKKIASIKKGSVVDSF